MESKTMKRRKKMFHLEPAKDKHLSQAMSLGSYHMVLIFEDEWFCNF